MIFDDGGLLGGFWRSAMALMASPGDCGENRPRISRFRGGKILYGPPFKLLVILKLMDMEELM